MRPIERKIPVNAIHLMVYEWGQFHPHKPSVLLLHATGFHARCWDAVIRHLDGFHCFAVDTRGHGRSDKPEPPHTWQQVGSDVTQLVQLLGLKRAIGVGHSMGGNSVVRAAAAAPQAFGALLLVDPVIMPKTWYALEEYSIEGHFILNRRRQWASADEMFARFKGRRPFASWREDVLRDYCDYALLPDENGYQLACAPEVEAHIYASTSLKTGMDIYDAISQVRVPVRILRCARNVAEVGIDLSASPTAPDLATHFANGIDISLPQNSHFIPMESPELVAAHIRELAELASDS